MRRLIPCLFALTLLTPGCARVPEGALPDGGRQIVVTLTVRGQIHPFDAPLPYHYFVLLNRTDDPNAAGPAPVVGPPWGNGFAAPSQSGAQGFNAFVRYDRFQPQSYGVYEVRGEPVFGNFVYLGAPDTFTAPQAGERTLTFRLSLDRLPNPDARYLQINLLATNNLPAGADASAPKSWDALGDGRVTGEINTYLTLDTTQSGTYRNSDTNTEPEGDVREKLGPTVNEPDLDIVDWTVEIRSGA